LKRYCEEAVSDEEFARAKELYPHNTPETKEGFYFRQIFEKLFPHQSAKNTVGVCFFFFFFVDSSNFVINAHNVYRNGFQRGVPPLIPQEELKKSTLRAPFETVSTSPSAIIS